MLLILFLITVVVGIFHPKSKQAALWVFVFSWLLISGNSDNNDFHQYKEEYEYIEWGFLLEPGFGLICYVFKALGFDYMNFKAIVSLICLTLIYRTIWKITDYKALGATLYLVYPFIVDITQIRNFIASSLVVFAIPLLFQKGKAALIKYLLLVIVATTVHSAVIFYIVFIFARKSINKFVMIVGIIIMSIIKVAVYNQFQTIFETEKLEVYEKPSIMGTLIMIAVLCLTAVIINNIYKHRNKRILDLSLPNIFVNEKIWPNITLLTLLLTPLLFDNASFTRVYRNIVILNMLFIINAYYINLQKRKVLITIFMFYFVSSYFIGSGYEYVLHPILSYNVFF